MSFRTIHERLTRLIETDGAAPRGGYEPDDVFDTHGLYVDIADRVDDMSDADFKEAALERCDLPEMFCDDCGAEALGKISLCGEHFEKVRVWGP